MEKTFAVLNDCLAFIVYNDESTMTEKYFDIWVMREYVVEDSWTKQLVVGPLLGIKEPLGFAKNGELLLRGGDEAIILYNIDSQEMKNLQCGGFPSTAMIYVESLVSFPSGNLS
nr:f-box protein cpr30 [Quercus suber]